MLIRRLSQNRRNIGIATLAIAFLFCVYLYYDLLSRLKHNDERNERLKAVQNSLSTQLQVVYEHKSRLERAIQDEKDSHHKTKEAKQDLEMTYSREKQELQNRFESLSQKQRLLQARFEDLQKEMSKSEAEYQLLKSDYQREIEDYKEKIFIQSQQCDKDKKFLTEEIDYLKQSQKEKSETLAQCKEAMKISQLHIDDQKKKLILHNSADNVNKPSLRLNQNQDSFIHIEKNSSSSAQVTDPAFGRSERKTLIDKEEIDNEKHVLVFQPDNIRNNLVHARDNRTVQQEDMHRFQAVPPPPHPITQRPLLIQEDDTMKGRDQLVRRQADQFGAIGVNAAVIEAPNETELKRMPNKDLNEDEDQEVEEKNEQNAADQKDDDDYQYDKNADDEEKVDEKVDDFPDAIPANKNLNKIQNPVYPDDVEVLNH